MTGLDKILKHIEEDVSNSANDVLKKAQIQADQIITDAKANGKEKSAEIMKKSEDNIKNILSRSQSASNLREKKLILEEKQQIINDVITKAKESFLLANEDEYFNNIVIMIKKYALPKVGQIVFSGKDLNRLPVGFQETINSSLTNIPEASLTISKETRNIDGGFILIYGDIEENCSFDALFFAARENLQDKVYALLFE